MIIVHVDGMSYIRISELWLPTGLLFTPQMIYDCGATLECYWQIETEELGEKPVPVPLHPPHPAWTDPDANLGFTVERPATNLPSRGTAIIKN
jgi:hypothetical protein